MKNYGFGDSHQPRRVIPKRVMHKTLPVNFPTTKSVAKFVRARLPLMADGLLHLDTDPHWVRISPYPIEVSFFSQDEKGRFVVASHIPDVGVIARDGTMAFIDYIPLNIQHANPHLRSRTEELKSIFREEHGASYAVHDERCLYIQPRWSNLKTMWKHKTTDKAALMAVRKALGRLPMPTTMSAVSAGACLPGFRTVWEYPGGEVSRDMENVDRAFSAVMQLAMDGEVWIDLSKPFDGSTAIDHRREGVSP